MTIPHPIRVALHFRPWQHAFWLGLFHDTVEDGLLPQALCRYWPALDAITRREVVDDTGHPVLDRKGKVLMEPYLAEYIPRVRFNITARQVKLADLHDNLNRPDEKGELTMRYARAKAYLEAPLAMGAA